jgi:hypothetical protein
MKSKSLYYVTDQESEQIYRGDPTRLPLKVVAQYHLSQSELDMLREDGEAAYEKASPDVKAAWQQLRAGQDVDLAWDEGTEGGYAVMEWRSE